MTIVFETLLFVISVDVGAFYRWIDTFTVDKTHGFVDVTWRSRDIFVTGNSKMFLARFLAVGSIGLNFYIAVKSLHLHVVSKTKLCYKPLMSFSRKCQKPLFAFHITAFNDTFSVSSFQQGRR